MTFTDVHVAQYEEVWIQRKYSCSMMRKINSNNCPIIVEYFWFCFGLIGNIWALFTVLFKRVLNMHCNAVSKYLSQWECLKLKLIYFVWIKSLFIRNWVSDWWERWWSSLARANAITIKISICASNNWRYKYKLQLIRGTHKSILIIQLLQFITKSILIITR